MDSKLAKQFCNLCAADICEACAKECEKYDMKHCKKCAQQIIILDSIMIFIGYRTC
jgi:hypothetical protein